MPQELVQLKIEIMTKEDLINALHQLEIDGEIVCNEHIENIAEKIMLIQSSSLHETPKVITNEEKKEEFSCSDIPPMRCMAHPECDGCPAFDK